MKYFKHGDKVKCFFGKVHDRLQDKFEWDTEEPREIEIRITKDYANPDELVIGLDDFNINYPGDVHGENEESVIFQLFNYAFCIMKEGKEFEVEKQKDQILNIENSLLNAKEEIKESQVKAGPDTHLMDLIKILKTLSVKKIIFEDGNEIEIN